MEPDIKPIPHRTASTSSFYVKDMFKGRIGRKHWLMGVVLGDALLFVGFFLVFKFFIPRSIESLLILMPTLGLGGIILFSSHIRRLHDLNWSGWTLFALAIPVFGLVMILILALYPGKEEKNRYGEQPPGDAAFWDVLWGRFK